MFRCLEFKQIHWHGAEKEFRTHMIDSTHQTEQKSFSKQMSKIHPFVSYKFCYVACMKIEKNT